MGVVVDGGGGGRQWSHACGFGCMHMMVHHFVLHCVFWFLCVCCVLCHAHSLLRS